MSTLVPPNLNGHTQEISTASTVVARDDGQHPREASSSFKPQQVPIAQNPNVMTIVPPEHPARTLVLCFDGTGDQFDADVSLQPCIIVPARLGLILTLDRIRISFDSFLCLRKMIVINSWFITRYYHLK